MLGSIITIIVGLLLFVGFAMLLTRQVRMDLDKSHKWCETCQLMVPDLYLHYHKEHVHD